MQEKNKNKATEKDRKKEITQSQKTIAREKTSKTYIFSNKQANKACKTKQQTQRINKTYQEPKATKMANTKIETKKKVKDLGLK